MSRPRLAAALGAALLGIAAVAIAVDRNAPAPAPVAERPAAARPTLLLLSSLPLVFAEQFTLAEGGSPALAALETRYKVVLVSAADTASLRAGRLLLMAHPLAQPAEVLVELDRWVRGGGHVLLLADPLLEWPSERPLGDPLRPPPAFADTGLLAHWGLRLEAPAERGPRSQVIAGRQVLTGSPGALTGRCDISKDRLMAHCRVGRGRATVIADADFLNLRDLDGPTQHNLDALLAELRALESR